MMMSKKRGLRKITKRNMKAAVQMQKEGGSDSTVVVFDVIPDNSDITLPFDVIPGSTLMFVAIPDSSVDVTSDNTAVVDWVISKNTSGSNDNYLKPI